MLFGHMSWLPFVLCVQSKKASIKFLFCLAIWLVCPFVLCVKSKKGSLETFWWICCLAICLVCPFVLFVHSKMISLAQNSCHNAFLSFIMLAKVFVQTNSSIYQWERLNFLANSSDRNYGRSYGLLSKMLHLFWQTGQSINW